MTTPPATAVRYESGEIVHLQIANVKVVEHADDGTLHFDYKAPSGFTFRGEVRPESEKVEITRVLPAAGLPKPGQVWTNAKGTLWFAVGKYENAVGLVDATGSSYSVHEAHREYGPIWPIWPLEDGA